MFDSECEWTNQSMEETQQGSVINAGHQDEPCNTLVPRSSLNHYSHNLSCTHKLELLQSNKIGAVSRLNSPI